MTQFCIYKPATLAKTAGQYRTPVEVIIIFSSRQYTYRNVVMLQGYITNAQCSIGLQFGYTMSEVKVHQVHAAHVLEIMLFY